MTVGTVARSDLPARNEKFKRRKNVAFGFDIALPRNPPVADAFDRVARVGPRRDIPKDRVGEFVDGVNALRHHVWPGLRMLMTTVIARTMPMQIRHWFVDSIDDFLARRCQRVYVQARCLAGQRYPPH
ncbi:hypothetical protein [Rhizobacter sp. Root1221]|uniref:hypothetical protein n=1 Tax=Rhizobacter sp. Root1221 TaxID=1736433 RepID=UPI001F180D75|nr:hypothetical protein [Rhizobacter sp. Root1221]